MLPVVSALLSSVNERKHIPVFSKGVVDINDYPGSVSVSCAYQKRRQWYSLHVLIRSCVNGNELHHKQGMKHCPTCRDPLICRICSRFAES